LYQASPIISLIKKKCQSQPASSLLQWKEGIISISVIPKGFIPAFRNGFAPVKIFNAIPKSPVYHGNRDFYWKESDVDSYAENECNIGE
jgi:hypothetical protein